jgi:hypothetical protein
MINVGDLQITGHLEITSNTLLENIDVIAGLGSIGGQLKIYSNPSLSTCSVTSVCHYLDVPINLATTSGNGPGCKTEDEVISRSSPIRDYHIVEANVEFDTLTAGSGVNIREWSPDDLVVLNNFHSGVATDSVSTVLISIETGSRGELIIPNALEEGFEFPWGDTTHLINNHDYFFSFYTPPGEFDEFALPYFYHNVVRAYLRTFHFTYLNGPYSRQDTFIIRHVCPPVVQVHGTYSNPEKAWRTASTVVSACMII